MELRWLASCGVLLFGASSLGAQTASVPKRSNKEEIYILRSVRTSRISPTDYCAQSRTGFSEPLFEEQYVFRTVSTDFDHGTVVNASGANTASGHTCFGTTVDSDVLNFYAEGDIAALHFTGRGKCATLKRDFPETGLNVVACFLELRELNDRYAGGLLTSNTIISRILIGDKSDPPGYVQSSIATVRLWRKRQ